jgi:hypothetical protein
MKILITESHLKKIKKYIISEEIDITEVAWETDKVKKITQGQIPLTPTVVKMLFGEPRKISAFHVTNEKNVDNIKNIIGKRSSISVFQYFSEEYLKNMRGVQTNGGVIMKVEGILDYVSSKDIFSTVDQSLTRRWIDSNLLSPYLYSTIKLFVQENEEHIRSNEFLKKYMNLIYQTLNKYKSEIKESIIQSVLTNPGWGDWNELLVRNIRVKEVVWKPSRVYGFCKTDQREKCKNIIQEFSRKIRSLSPERVIEIGDNENDELINWFKTSGGYTNINDFSNNFFNDKTDILKGTKEYFREKLKQVKDPNMLPQIFDEFIKSDFNFNLLIYSIDEMENKPMIIEYMLKTDVILNKLNGDSISIILRDNENRKKYTNIILNNKNISDNVIFVLLSKTDDFKETYNRLGKRGFNFISNLNKYDLSIFLKMNNRHIEDTFEILLGNEKFLTTLTNENIIHLFQRHPNKVELYKFLSEIGKMNQFIEFVTSNNNQLGEIITGNAELFKLLIRDEFFIRILPERAKSLIILRLRLIRNAEEILNSLMENEEFIKKLTFDDIKDIFNGRNMDFNNFINQLIKRDFIPNYNIIINFFRFSNDSELIFKTYKKNIISHLTGVYKREFMTELLSSSLDPYKTIDLFLNDEDIINVINSDLIIMMLKKDKRKVNYVLDTPKLTEKLEPVAYVQLMTEKIVNIPTILEKHDVSFFVYLYNNTPSFFGSMLYNHMYISKKMYEDLLNSKESDGISDDVKNMINKHDEIIKSIESTEKFKSSKS